MKQIRKGKLEAQIDFPNLRLNINTTEPTKGLREITRILHSLRHIELRDWADEEISWRLGWLSDEIRNNNECMAFIKSAMEVEEGSRHRKISLVNKKIVDLEKKQYTSTIEKQGLQKKLSQLTVGTEKANYGLVHVASSVAEEDKNILIEQIRKQVPHAQIKAVFTNKELLGKTVIEAVFFGSFPEEY
ncbi:hypothetical protein HY486_04645 [Candidatus Woesearchaeota archaeon]|nr:hypothetical protein [Candidatus Woesearchaeota archaeon]